VDQLEAHGATLVAITPQGAEHNRELVEKHKMTIDLLTDPGNEVAAAFGLKFTLAPEIKAAYQKFGIDLPALNGDDSWTLPMPGRFVADTSGRLRAVDADPDYTHRPEPQATVDVVASL